MNNSYSQQNTKKKINSFNQTVASIVKKELQKRHESPRSRRQLLSNLVNNSKKGDYTFFPDQ